MIYNVETTMAKANAKIKKLEAKLKLTTNVKDAIELEKGNLAEKLVHAEVRIRQLTSVEHD